VVSLWFSAVGWRDIGRSASGGTAVNVSDGRPG